MFNLQQYLMSGGTPQQLLSSMMLQNPMITNLMQMAKKGDTKSVELFARNLLKEQGRDFDSEFAEFKKRFNR